MRAWVYAVAAVVVWIGAPIASSRPTPPPDSLDAGGNQADLLPTVQAWTAQGGSGSGALVASVNGVAQYLSSRGIQTSPSTHETLLANGTAPRVYDCWHDQSGSKDYLVYSNDATFAVANADDLSDTALEIALNGWGTAYPFEGATYYSLTDQDPDAVYLPRAARLHDGLLMVACSVGDRTDGTANPASQTRTVTIDKASGTITAIGGTFLTDTWNNGGDGVYVRIEGSVLNDGHAKLESVDSETQLTVNPIYLAGDETDTPNVTLVLEAWRPQNRTAMLSHEIGASTWVIGAEDAYPSNYLSASLGRVWMMGQPITVTHNGTTYMFLGSTNYQNKDGANSGQRAYVDRWTLSGGSWSYDGRVLLYEVTDAMRSAYETHFHTAHVYWDGTNLRVKVAIGDGFDDNGVMEFSIAGVNIFGAPITSGLATNFYAPSAGWTNHGFIHGGNTPVNSGGDTYPSGMQPTWLITTSDGRTHWGADEGVPAVCGFDESGRNAGDPLTDNTPEYLTHVTNAGVGLCGYVSLVADCDDPDSPTVLAAVVGPSGSYGDSDHTLDKQAMIDRQLAATRIAYYSDGRWHTISHVATRNANGIAVDSIGRVYIATNAGDIVRITPGTLAPRSPLVSSPGGTNAIANANYVDTTVSSRLTLSNPTPGLDGAPTLPDAVDPDAVMSRADTAPALAVNGSGQLRLTESGTTQYLKDGSGEAPFSRLQANVWFCSTAPVSHVLAWSWKSSTAGPGQSIDEFDPGTTAVPTGPYIGNSWNGYPERTTTRISTQEFTANDWLEMSAVSDRRATLTDDAEFMAEWHTAVSLAQSAEFSALYTVVGAVFIDPAQRVLLDVDYGQTVPDTDISWSGLPINPFPLVVAGVTHPRGSASREVAIVQKELLFRLHESDSQYIQLNFDPINNRLELAYDIGAGEVTASLGDCEWTRETDVIVRIDRSGSDLVVRGSIYGDPYGPSSVIGDAGLLSWAGSELRQYDGVFQGVLQVSDIETGTLCTADLTTLGADAGNPSYGVPDSRVTAADLLYYVNDWTAGLPTGDLTTQGASLGDPGYGVPDGLVSSTDLNYYVNLWIDGCP